jgi:hypothetical protein
MGKTASLDPPRSGPGARIQEGRRRFLTKAFSKKMLLKERKSPPALSFTKHPKDAKRSVIQRPSKTFQLDKKEIL